MDPLKLNKAIEAIFQLLFLNTAISTLFWIFLPSLTKYFPSIPFAFVCYPLGFCCFLIARIRQKIPISDWSREVVVLTGGSHGIGARLCDILLEKGAKVIVIDRMKPLTGI
jgi:hypothetical protein